MKGWREGKESMMIKSEVKREVKKERGREKERGSLPAWNGVWKMERSKTEWREWRENEREGEWIPGEKPVAARVSKAKVSSTKVYPPSPPLGMACRPIFTIPRLPTIPFGFSLINFSNSRASCLEFVGGVWERIHHQSVCKSKMNKIFANDSLIVIPQSSIVHFLKQPIDHSWTYLKQEKIWELKIWNIIFT